MHWRSTARGWRMCIAVEASRLKSCGDVSELCPRGSWPAENRVNHHPEYGASWWMDIPPNKRSYFEVEDPIACLRRNCVHKTASALSTLFSRKLWQLSLGQVTRSRSHAASPELPEHSPEHRTPSPWVTKQVFHHSRQNSIPALSLHELASKIKSQFPITKLTTHALLNVSHDKCLLFYIYSSSASIQ